MSHAAFLQAIVAEPRRVGRRLAALDPEKLETLVLDRGVRDVRGVWGELQERFPGRVSVV
jgi:hypothetical protein